MSKSPAEPSEPEPSGVNDDPASIAWEERRRAWLKASPAGQRRATQATVDRVAKALNPQSEDEKKAFDRIILGIKERLATREPLKEPMPLGLMVSLLYKSWFVDGTITEDMVKEGRADTDKDIQSQNKSSTKP